MTFFSLLSKVPIVGSLLRITNAYVYDGDERSASHLAQPWFYIRALGWEFGFAIFLAFICMPGYLQKLSPWHVAHYHVSDKTPGDLITSILPNLLGFGIGVYALIFAMDATFLQKLRTQVEKPRNGVPPSGSVLTINAHMAFPLTVLVTTLAIGSLATVLDKSCLLTFVSWTLFWLSMIATLQLVSTLFHLGETVILERIKRRSHSPDESSQS